MAPEYPPLLRFPEDHLQEEEVAAYGFEILLHGCKSTSFRRLNPALLSVLDLKINFKVIKINFNALKINFKVRISPHFSFSLTSSQPELQDLAQKENAMLINIHSAKCIGIEAVAVTVEIDIAPGLGIHLVGLADAAVKESLLRTITALQSMGFRIPGKKIVINLAPADMHKKGSGYDVPIALGIIAASRQREMPLLGEYMIMGELGLDGTVREIAGALPIVELAIRSGLKGCILPLNSAIEAVEFGDIKIYGVESLDEVLRIVEGGVCDDLLASSRTSSTTGDSANSDIGISSCGCDAMDFSEIIGQEAAKRGLEIAAAGGHHAILIGSPGSGKSSFINCLRILSEGVLGEGLVKLFQEAWMGFDEIVNCNGEQKKSYVQITYVFDYKKLNNYATSLWSRNLPIEADRGKILDRNGVVLADNITTTSLVLIPNQLEDKEKEFKWYENYPDNLSY